MWDNGGVTDTPEASRTPRAAAGDVLQLLLDRRPWTRADLARATSLSRSTIVSRLDALREVGLVREVGRLSPAGGRPTTKIAFNDRVRTVAGVELGHSSCRITIADLGTRPLGQVTLSVVFTDDYEHILESIASALRRLLADVDEEHGELASITLGLPMSATLDSGGLLQTRGVGGWMGYPVREWLEKELAVSVHLENDVNLMALGERMETYPDIDDILFVYDGDGVGTASIAGGHLVRGATGLAGEIAHLPTPRNHGELCLCGNTGCLAAVATLPAVLRDLRREGLSATTLDDLMQLVSQGDPSAARILREAGRHLGDVLIYSISSTNPSVLVLNGSLAFAGDYFVAGIREVLYGKGVPTLTNGLQVVRSANPLGAGSRGALQLSADHVLTDGKLLELLEEPASQAI